MPTPINANTLDKSHALLFDPIGSYILGAICFIELFCCFVLSVFVHYCMTFCLQSGCVMDSFVNIACYGVHGKNSVCLIEPSQNQLHSKKDNTTWILSVSLSHLLP